MDTNKTNTDENELRNDEGYPLAFVRGTVKAEEAPEYSGESRLEEKMDEVNEMRQIERELLDDESIEEEEKNV